MVRAIAASSLLVMLAVTAPIVGAFAQGAAHSGTPEQERACSRDVSRYCRHVMNNGDEAIFGCLKEHHSRLSKACRKTIDSGGH